MPRPKKNSDACEGKDKALCPVFFTLSLIANKWSVSILHHLLTANNNTMRFNEIKNALVNITQAELAKQLKEFDKAGFVDRKSYPCIPPKVEYKLTPLGHSLLIPIQALSQWAQNHGQQVRDNMAYFEAARTQQIQFDEAV